MAQFQRRVSNADAANDKDQLWPVPQSQGNATMPLADLVGQAEVNAITAAGLMQFQATGDTGMGLNSSQPEVAQAMARDINVQAPAQGPIFFLNLGDVIYGPNKKSRYPNRFYRPNMPLLKPAPGFNGVILGIPGNHDGEVRDPADDPSLNGFLENFVAPAGTVPPMAKSFGVVMPHQPGVYWRLNAPFLDLIGLYSNAAEDFGTLSKDGTDAFQQAWLADTLTQIKAERADVPRKALILAMHHPPYARGLQGGSPGQGHPGSPAMQQQLDTACAAAGIWPDAVLSGHSHNYQRYKRQCRTPEGGSFDTAYFVAGTGGIQTEPAPSDIGASRADAQTPGLAGANVVYGSGLESHGYLRVAASATQLQISFVQTDRDHRNVFETVTLDLATQRQITP